MKKWACFQAFPSLFPNALMHARDLFQYGPIRHLDIQGSYWLQEAVLDPTAVKTAIALPEMRWVRRLTLDRIDSEAARAVARSPSLEQLARLRISRVALDDDATALLRARFRERLELQELIRSLGDLAPGLATAPLNP
jgi:hypothetical protein